MIKNKIFFLTIFIFLTQCGYQTIYSNKNTNFYISEIKILNNQNIGRQIENRLSLLTNASKNIDNYYLEIDSKFEKTTASKDKQGNPKTFNLIVIVKVNLTIKDNLKETKVFSESINYNNSDNKFNLKRYEDSLKENLTEKIIDNLLIYLQSISSNKSNASLTGNVGYTMKK
tara:strand:+ start:324 stop:839 length:516 start_codon:yes stop_codon:yes gene_type:complete